MSYDEHIPYCARFSECPRYSTEDRDYGNRRPTITTLLSFLNLYSSSSSLSQWEVLMRKFSDDFKRIDHHCTVDEKTAVACEQRPLKIFSSGSTYEGTWDALGMCGYGIYTFPNGVVYRGEFTDSMFHGNGEMFYPDGIKIRGKWDSGELISQTVIFSDNLQYEEENWEYCKPPDRRYAREFKEGPQPEGISIITNDETMRDLPDGTYDTGDGIFHPETSAVFDHNDHTRCIRSVDDTMKKWIENNCRKSSDGPIGPHPELYKKWHNFTLKKENPPSPPHIPDPVSETFDTAGENWVPAVSKTFRRSRFSSCAWGKRMTFKFHPEWQAAINYLSNEKNKLQSHHTSKDFQA